MPLKDDISTHRILSAVALPGLEDLRPEQFRLRVDEETQTITLFERVGFDAE